MLGAIDQGLMSLIIIVSLVAFFGLIVLAVILVKRKTNWFKKDEKPSESKIVKDELNRVLQDVDDEETIKAMKEYEQNKPQETSDKKDEPHQ